MSGSFAVNVAAEASLPRAHSEPEFSLFSLWQAKDAAHNTHPPEPVNSSVFARLLPGSRASHGLRRPPPPRRGPRCGCLRMSRANQVMLGFACLFAGAVFLATSLFFIVLWPRKFAVFATFGSLGMFCGTGFLRGCAAHCAELLLSTRKYFALSYAASLGLLLLLAARHARTVTLLAALALHAAALSWYLIAFIPGGPAALVRMLRVGRSFAPL